MSYLNNSKTLFLASILLVWSATVNFSGYFSYLTFVERNVTGSWSTCFCELMRCRWFHRCQLISGSRIGFKGAFKGPTHFIFLSLSTWGPRVMNTGDYIHQRLTPWQVCASVFVSVVASLTNTCCRFIFQSFRRGSLKPIGFGHDSQRDSQFGRPLQISHCRFICRMPPYMSWDSETEADVVSCGWQERTSAFALWNQYSTA